MEAKSTNLMQGLSDALHAVLEHIAHHHEELQQQARAHSEPGTELMSVELELDALPVIVSFDQRTGALAHVRVGMNAAVPEGGMIYATFDVQTTPQAVMES